VCRVYRLVVVAIILLASIFALAGCGVGAARTAQPTLALAPVPEAPEAASVDPTSSGVQGATRAVGPPTPHPSQAPTDASPEPAPRTDQPWPSPTAMPTSLPQLPAPSTATPLPAMTGPAAEAPAPARTEAVVQADRLNVRAGPGTAYRRIGQLDEGAAVEIAGRDEEGTWWQIVYPTGDEGLGWVSADYIEAPIEIAETPAVAMPSRPSTPIPDPLNPLMIEVMRQRSYPGSEVTIEAQLDPGSNYDRYITSYRSDGLKIYALLTVPRGERPGSGWPVIVFNHGYIPPAQYRTTERYVAYVDAFARNGYIVFRPDYRGHGNSEGDASSSYGSPDYTIDVLNAVASVKRYPDADPGRIGMWGHSMGGSITLRAMVVTEDIKAGVIWAGSIAPYPDLIERWGRRSTSIRARRPWVEELLAHGTIEKNPAFWASIDPVSYLSDLSGPIQLHHGTADESVPVEYSENLYAKLQEAGQPAELYLYEGDNHNLSRSLDTAMARSIHFFDTHVSSVHP
jgi:fermentation-respiration switch protein FrsA (DUF1100 family)